MAGSTKEYTGGEAVVSYDAKRCIHAAECVHGLPGVFNPDARPWINPDGAPVEELAQVVARCPTGALRLTFRDGRAAEGPPAANTASVCADGPVYLRGRLTVADAEGTISLQETRVALCRCGASRNKPFCDGSHEQAGFKDPGKVSGKIETMAPGGALKLTLIKNGPVQADGVLEIAGSEGTPGYRGRQCWLCRCGASKNKPFCDGSHNGIGFKA